MMSRHHRVVMALVTCHPLLSPALRGPLCAHMQARRSVGPHVLLIPPQFLPLKSKGTPAEGRIHPQKGVPVPMQALGHLESQSSERVLKSRAWA